MGLRSPARRIGPSTQSLPSGQPAHETGDVGPLRAAAALRASSPGASEGHAGRPATRRGAGDAEAEPRRAPNPRRPARFTLACNRAGAQAKQVQVPLRCAEGTYSWCSRLLAVSHTRR